MKLSDIEKKMIARLRRKQEQMIRWRWFLLIVGFSCLGATAYGLSVLFRFLDKPDLASALVISGFLPQLYMTALFGAGAIGYTCANWNGNPQDRLLLKLIDEKSDT